MNVELICEVKMLSKIDMQIRLMRVIALILLAESLCALLAPVRAGTLDAHMAILVSITCSFFGIWIFFFPFKNSKSDAYSQTVPKILQRE
ncbi:MAG: hypothetical protein OQK82_06430 [Candidatus Pacearchaeota archaeon]|nr:hypothetical protein [Candidatus Pacearchaeota archaeon]